MEAALSVCESETERQSLESLRSDLQELVQLTQQTSSDGSQKSEDSMDDEMALFMSEINSLDNEDKLNAETENEILGSKCSAPYTHSWGGKSYHNALIYQDNRLESGTVLVMFTNPTHQEMIPCSFYLDGHCRFDNQKCRYSHGENVEYNELKEYKEPNFSILGKTNCLVLIKLEDKMWHKAIVQSVDYESKKCKVKLQNKKMETEIEFEYILPVDEIGESDSDDDSTEFNNDKSDDEDEYKKMRDAQIVERSLMTIPTDKLGQWEDHTRGMGSKLMQKMGYIIGAGLGKRGEGIVIPISAQVLPPGRSLDHCMNLREQANGDRNLFSVERKLKKLQDKQKAINEKAYTREKPTNVFDFINNQIFNPPPAPSTPSYQSVATPSTSKQVINNTNFKNHTAKKLNVASFEVSENIRKKEREIDGLQKSLERQKAGSQIYSSIQMQIDGKKNELNELKRSEKCIIKEQNHRNNKNKLDIF